MFDLSQSNYLVQPKGHDLQSPPTHSQDLPNATAQCQNQCNPPPPPLCLNSRREGKWSLREIMRYYTFIVEFKYLFQSKELRKTKRVFALMARHIRSRATSQCKSHHQKIQKNYGPIEQIIIYHRALLAPLTQEWQEFQKTETRAILNEFPQLNSSQDFYQILEFKNCLRIYIREEGIGRYE